MDIETDRNWKEEKKGVSKNKLDGEGRSDHHIFLWIGGY